MSKRERGTYGTLDNRVLRYAKTHWDASSSVLIALAERANFRNSVMKVPELMLETDLGQRAVEKCLLKLEANGLAARCANGWTYRSANQGTNDQANGEANQGANDDANRRANDGSQGQEGNTEQDGDSGSLKEVEGNQKEEQIKDSPLTPQGDSGSPSPDPEPAGNPAPDADSAQAPHTERPCRACRMPGIAGCATAPRDG